jgi:hypothetical protein
MYRLATYLFGSAPLWRLLLIWYIRHLQRELWRLHIHAQHRLPFPSLPPVLALRATAWRSELGHGDPNQSLDRRIYQGVRSGRVSQSLLRQSRMVEGARGGCSSGGKKATSVQTRRRRGMKAAASTFVGCARVVVEEIEANDQWTSTNSQDSSGD